MTCTQDNRATEPCPERIENYREPTDPLDLAIAHLHRATNHVWSAKGSKSEMEHDLLLDAAHQAAWQAIELIPQKMQYRATSGSEIKAREEAASLPEELCEIIDRLLANNEPVPPVFSNGTPLLNILFRKTTPKDPRVPKKRSKKSKAVQPRKRKPRLDAKRDGLRRRKPGKRLIVR